MRFSLYFYQYFLELLIFYIKKSSCRADNKKTDNVSILFDISISAWLGYNMYYIFTMCQTVFLGYAIWEMPAL